MARLQNELSNVRNAMRSAVSQSEKAKRTEDNDFWLAAAFSLQNFYMGTERIFEDVAKQIDNALPSGANSHRELLEQMALNIADTRPPVILQDTLERLQDYRGFRHVAIHRYGFELRPDRIRELVEILPDTVEMLSRDVKSFCEFLIALEKNI
ncbi:hypothetical protein [Synechococcus sp. PCC 7502]|uniref:ribonuclease toxin HepT-like protein n=1 Tax=Synechococcus sp. PCC 7502 TaxID=1173263 RepID=UPI001AF00BD2|nr:hypothetical protein [Synechococcus sp. PCC 7502]